MHNLKSIVDPKQPNKKGGNVLKHSKNGKKKKKKQNNHLRSRKNTSTPRLLARNTKFKNKLKETKNKKATPS